MTIAIDYDHTWTLAPSFWKLFAFQCSTFGHRLVCITCRHPDDSVPDDVGLALNCVCYTSGIAKQAYAEASGLSIDVWIDDDPGTICPSKKLSDVSDISL